MKRASLPVYDIDKFIYLGKESSFYANRLSAHIRQFGPDVLTAHGHSFYLSIFCTKGSGTHEIEFNRYDIKPGSLFMLFPGQVHSWNVSKDIEGYVFFHTAEFYNLNFIYEKIENFPFFSCTQNSPLILVPADKRKRIEYIYEQIVIEYQGNELMKFQKICSQLNVLYIELSRLYLPVAVTEKQNKNQLTKMRTLQGLIDSNYKRVKFPKDYAQMMHMTEKHLNRISKATLNKTTSEVIRDRIILEAKRMLMYSTESVSQIADELGYDENSYFFRMFKKNAGKTPLEFLKKFRKD